LARLFSPPKPLNRRSDSACAGSPANCCRRIKSALPQEPCLKLPLSPSWGDGSQIVPSPPVGGEVRRNVGQGPHSWGCDREGARKHASHCGAASRSRVASTPQARKSCSTLRGRRVRGTRTQKSILPMKFCELPAPHPNPLPANAGRGSYFLDRRRHPNGPAFCGGLPLLLRAVLSQLLFSILNSRNHSYRWARQTDTRERQSEAGCAFPDAVYFRTLLPAT
jgi:hypothetical protein